MAQLAMVAVQILKITSTLRMYTQLRIIWGVKHWKLCMICERPLITLSIKALSMSNCHKNLCLNQRQLPQIFTAALAWSLFINMTSTWHLMLSLSKCCQYKLFCFCLLIVKNLNSQYWFCCFYHVVLEALSRCGQCTPTTRLDQLFPVSPDQMQ